MFTITFQVDVRLLFSKLGQSYIVFFPVTEKNREALSVSWEITILDNNTNWYSPNIYFFKSTRKCDSIC